MFYWYYQLYWIWYYLKLLIFSVTSSFTTVFNSSKYFFLIFPQILFCFLKLLAETAKCPLITKDTRYQVHIVVAPSNIRILDLNPTRDVEVCLVLSVPVSSCERKGVRSLESAQFLALVNAALNFLFHEEPWNFSSWTNVIDQKLGYMPLNMVS